MNLIFYGNNEVENSFRNHIHFEILLLIVLKVWYNKKIRLYDVNDC